MANSAQALPGIRSTRYNSTHNAAKEQSTMQGNDSQPATYSSEVKVPLGDYDPRQDNYYAKTAYGTDRPHAKRYSANPDETYPKQFKFKRLSYHADIYGMDYLGNSAYKDAYQREPSMKPEKGEIAKLQDSVRAQPFDAYHTIYFSSGRNIAQWFYLPAIIGYGMCTFIFVIMLVFTPIAYFFGIYNSWTGFFQMLLYDIVFAASGFIIWKLFGWLGYKMPNNKFAKMKRRTGMICFPQKGKLPDKEMPFSEFEPRSMLTSGSGGLSHRLYYVHQSGSPTLALGYRTRLDVYTRAAFLEQFMDITKPLPDIPSLEWCRDKDPTTKAFDQATGRPPRYWRDMSSIEIQAERKATSAKVESILGKGSASC